MLLRLLKPKKRKRRLILRPKGAVYNLQEIYDSLNREYFDAKLNLKISWFGRKEKIPKTKITFGSYNYLHQLIKVHRLLDQKEVPLAFVRYIVYHEMLHNVLPPKRKKRGQNHIHHKNFKAKEKEFKEFSEATAFLKQWREKHFVQSGVQREVAVSTRPR